MLDVEVHHSHPFQLTGAAGTRGGDGGMVEDAEAYGAVRLRVVAARTGGAEHVGGFTQHHPLQRGEHGPFQRFDMAAAKLAAVLPCRFAIGERGFSQLPQRR